MWKGLIATLAIFVLNSNGGIVNGELALQISSGPPPNDAVSVTWKATRPTTPSMADEFGPQDNAYVCSRGGVWIAYREQSYVGDGILTPGVYCGSQWYAPNAAKSVWLLESSKNLSVPTMNLFPQLWWGGVTVMLTTTEDQPSLSQFVSFVSTGVSAVTFYEGYEYEGRAVCVTANGATVAFDSDLATIGLGPAGVKSFRFGCFATSVVHSNSDNDSLNIRH